MPRTLWCARRFEFPALCVLQPGGGVLLLGASAGDESSTDGDMDEWGLGPPSPCNVVFEGSNIIINGRSNLRKQQQQQQQQQQSQQRKVRLAPS